jgi:flagellar motor switch protein FliG
VSATASRSRRDTLTGAQKCAVLCIALGTAGAAQILQKLAPDEVERVTREIAGMSIPDPELMKSVLEEFRDASRRGPSTPRGGPEYAAQVLEQAVGVARAKPMLARISGASDSGLSRLRQAAPETLAGLLRDEHPQAMAAVLAHLDDRQSLNLLKAMDPDRAQDVMWRLARLGSVSSETLRLIEKELLSRLAPVSVAEIHGEGGPERVARILNLAGEDFEKPALAAMEAQDQEMATRVRQLMFTFEDLLRIDSRGMQRVLREVDGKELAMALKVASDELKAHIRKAMSERAAAALDEEIEMLGPVRIKDVEAAHMRIIDNVRSLGQAGELQIQGGGGDDLV